MRTSFDMKDYSVIITHYQRQENLRNTLTGLSSQTILPNEVIVVDMGDGVGPLDAYAFELNIIELDKRWNFMPLAAARNLGADHSICPHLVFLDVDCIPATDFCEKMVKACFEENALVMGSPRYMLSGKGGNPLMKTLKMRTLKEGSIFHPARPLIMGTKSEGCYELFWSLCFSIPKEQFTHVGGFDEGYEGYGAEDTAFALQVKKAGVPFFLSDAEVYHQQHPIYVPPLNHLEAIVKNSNRFYRKWGYWPMVDCLEEFTEMGYIDWKVKRDIPIVLNRRPSTSEIQKQLVKNAPYR